LLVLGATSAAAAVIATSHNSAVHHIVFDAAKIAYDAAISSGDSTTRAVEDAVKDASKALKRKRIDEKMAVAAPEAAVAAAPEAAVAAPEAAAAPLAPISVLKEIDTNCIKNREFPGYMNRQTRTAMGTSYATKPENIKQRIRHSIFTNIHGGIWCDIACMWDIAFTYEMFDENQCQQLCIGGSSAWVDDYPKDLFEIKRV
jgi:aspartate carbamoyltransferase regulatory subunit